MEFIAEQNYLLLSPRKIRPIVYAIKRLTPKMALEVLPSVEKKGAEPLFKVIKSAITNAKSKGVSDTELTFKEIQINEGPRLKRGRPVSRGMWHPIKKRMSHIRVILQTVEKKVAKEVKAEVKKEETNKSLTSKAVVSKKVERKAVANKAVASRK